MPNPAAHTQRTEAMHLTQSVLQSWKHALSCLTALSVSKGQTIIISDLCVYHIIIIIFTFTFTHNTSPLHLKQIVIPWKKNQWSRGKHTEGAVARGRIPWLGISPCTLALALPLGPKPVWGCDSHHFPPNHLPKWNCCSFSDRNTAEDTKAQLDCYGPGLATTSKNVQ